MARTDLRPFFSSEHSAAAGRASVRLAEFAPFFGFEIDDPRLGEVAFPVRRIKAGESLVRAGDPFDAIYFVRCGFFKTVRVDEAGNEVVLALPMTGEAIGLDGLDPGHYTADVVALDTSLVAAVPFAQLAHLGRENASIERALFRAFSRALGREHSMICLLGTLSAEARVASFLLDLSDRFGRLGYSRTDFALRMTRQEIGSYLGLKLETVSRTFSALAASGAIGVDRKTITINDLAALQAIMQPKGEEPEMRPAPGAVRAQGAHRPSPRLAREARGRALAFA
ncbi:MAG: helix-turn-helix domain-containing protein [Burkholderiales bacterium]|nr:helix-turn-helix domain-containing protein [Burkholderiales bacterium]